MTNLFLVKQKSWAIIFVQEISHCKNTRQFWVYFVWFFKCFVWIFTMDVSQHSKNGPKNFRDKSNWSIPTNEKHAHSAEIATQWETPNPLFIWCALVWLGLSLIKELQSWGLQTVKKYLLNHLEISSENLIL